MHHVQRTPEADALWRGLLTGTHPLLRRHRRVLNLLPGAPRCKLCSVPFGGFCGQLFRFSGKRPSNLNPAYCSICDDLARTHPGGAELELAFVFADVRGSTALAESMSAADFRDLMNRFYDTAIRLFTRSDAMIDKLVGDEVVALYLPAFAGEDFTARALRDSRNLLAATGHGRQSEPWIPVGIGVHTGTAFVGSVGAPGGHTDFTALGDAVNVAARLTASAQPGEILASEVACRAAALDPPAEATWRALELSGRTAPVRAVSLGASAAAID